MLLKIDKMHYLFGISEGNKCKNCNNLEKRTWDKTYNKCSCYGISSCISTDWKISNVACGLFNKQYNGKKAVKITINNDIVKPIEGQISMI